MVGCRSRIFLLHNQNWLWPDNLALTFPQCALHKKPKHWWHRSLSQWILLMDRSDNASVSIPLSLGLQPYKPWPYFNRLFAVCNTFLWKQTFEYWHFRMKKRMTWFSHQSLPNTVILCPVYHAIIIQTENLQSLKFVFTERAIPFEHMMYEHLQKWGPRKQEVKFFLRHEESPTESSDQGGCAKLHILIPTLCPALPHLDAMKSKAIVCHCPSTQSLEDTQVS